MKKPSEAHSEIKEKKIWIWHNYVIGEALIKKFGEIRKVYDMCSKPRKTVGKVA